MQQHSTMYQRFRITPSKARAIVLWGLTVPVLTYYAAKYTDVSVTYIPAHLHYSMFGRWTPER